MDQKLHIFFFPFLAQGHMLPTLDMAKVFCSRGVKSTMITTDQHVHMFEKSIQKNRKQLFTDISIRAIHFPAVEAGLPEGTESVDQIKSEHLIPHFIMATAMLQDQLEQLLEECRPHCLIADKFFPWATESAAKFRIPRLVFDGTSSFSDTVDEILRVHRPFDYVSSDSEPFLVPDLPHEITLTRAKIPSYERDKETAGTELGRFLQRVRDSDSKSYGRVVNSFYELEPEYVEYCTKILGRKAWHVGPFLLCNKEVEDKIGRGKKSDIDEHECLKWLDSKKPNSVVYLCFGSRANFTLAQLQEIAKGLESSGQDFIWVVRNCVEEEDSEKWFPKGFEEKILGKGLIIKGWAPQLLILEHESTGAFVTHCGWNSTLEGVCSGVPLVTWPMFAEQFVNEKLLIDVLKIGVAVGSKEWGRVAKDVVKGEALAKAVELVMVGEEAVKMRGRSKALKDMARKAVEEGGSSYADFDALINELKSYRSERDQE